MDEELSQKLKYLRLGGLLANWDRYLGLAQKDNYSHTRLLEHIVDQEYQIKKENSRKMRLNRAKIPEKWVIETFPFDRQPKLNKKKTVGMYDAFDYMSKCRNIIFIGPTGVGKSGLATSFSIASRARSLFSFILPPSRYSGFRYPRTRFASVTVGLVPPLS